MVTLNESELSSMGGSAQAGGWVRARHQNTWQKAPSRPMSVPWVAYESNIYLLVSHPKLLKIGIENAM